jgi:hypothetical protein
MKNAFELVMIRFILVIFASLLLAGCTETSKPRFEGTALLVTHSPNPSNIHTSEKFPKPAYPYTWYYKTIVKNNSDRDLKVIWFEGYVDYNNHWIGSNILNRTLRNDAFLKWYGNELGNPTNDEWIRPSESRICDINWHGSDDPKGYRIKWGYIAVDKLGNDYYSEAIIESVPIK